MANKTSFLFFTSFFFFFLGYPDFGNTVSANAQEYAIPEISVQARIDTSGTVFLSESRTYHFKGSFSWADYRLPRRGFDQVHAIRISEGDHWFVNDNSGEPGTFTVAKSDKEIVIRWNYEARDTERTFTVHYELIGALAEGPEWTEFFWTWLASGREKATDHFTLLLQLPGTQTESIYAWCHKPLQDCSLEVGDGLVLLHAQNLSVREPVVTRVLFPTEWLEAGARAGAAPELSLEAVQKEEAARIEQERRRQERREWYRDRAIPLNGAFILASLGFFMFMYRRHGRRYRPSQSELQPPGVLPGPLSPVLAGALLSSGIIQSVHMLGCIFDLARRGWLVVRQKESGKKKTWYRTETTEFFLERADKIPQESLLSFEKQLLKYLNERIEAGKNRLDKIFSNKSKDFGQWYQDWEKSVKEHIDAQQWIDKSNRKGIWLHVAGQILLLIPTLLMLIRGGPLMIPALLFTGVMLFASAGMYRRTKAGEVAYQRWKAYYKALRTQGPGVTGGGSMEQHFVYATAFGIPSKNVSRLLKTAEGQELQPVFLWLILVPGMSRTPSQVVQSLSTLQSTGTTTFTTSVSGGGVSAGSAGGGASGGAG